MEDLIQREDKNPVFFIVVQREVINEHDEDNDHMAQYLIDDLKAAGTDLDELMTTFKDEGLIIYGVGKEPVTNYMDLRMVCERIDGVWSELEGAEFKP